MTEKFEYPPNMPQPIRRSLVIIDNISIWSGKTFAWLIIPLVGALVYEVISRYFFNAPTLWAYELSYMLYSAHFMLVAAYGLVSHEHIRTDFLYGLMPARWQGAVDAWLYLFFYIPAMIIFLWITFQFAIDSWAMSERSTLSPWMPPIYPLKTVLPVTAALLLLQGISEFFKSYYAAKAGSWS